jgi:hypothetical protein
LQICGRSDETGRAALAHPLDFVILRDLLVLFDLFVPFVLPILIARAALALIGTTLLATLLLAVSTAARRAIAITIVLILAALIPLVALLSLVSLIAELVALTLSLSSLILVLLLLGHGVSFAGVVAREGDYSFQTAQTNELHTVNSTVLMAARLHYSRAGRERCSTFSRSFC